MQNPILEYRALLNKNSEVFLLNFKEEFAAFSETDESLQRIGDFLSRNRMRDGKSLISLLPHLLIMQRQFRNAFQCFTVFQSYQAWVILRPSIESALIMGKWLDDIENVEIWKEHKGDWQKYNKIYSGKSLASKSLPQSSRIQQVLKVINDDYMHVNPVYYFNNTGLQQMGADNIIFIPFFDEEIEHKSHLYSFLHLTLLVIKSIAEMLAPYFHQHDELRIDLVRLQIAFKNRVAAIVKENPEQLLVLRELGLWPNNLFEQSAVI